jgi:hypothetical protein
LCDSTFVGLASPDVPFTKIEGSIIFLSEQFWGRAARASNDSRESDARFFLISIENWLDPAARSTLIQRLAKKEIGDSEP